MSEVQLWELSQPERQAILDEATRLGEKHVKALWEQLLRQAGGSKEEVDRRLSEGK
jgi:hypothetical protein